MKLCAFVAIFACSAILSSSFAWSEEIPPPQKGSDEAIAALTKENARLQEKLKALEECSISSSALALKSCNRLKEIAADVKVQRQGLADLEAYVKWMSNNVAGYSKYLAAGSAAAGFAKVLPIPYAGEASACTKFISNAAISLSAASVSINNYLAVSQRFITGVEALDPAKGLHPSQVSELVQVADRDLLKGMIEVQGKLASTSDLSASSLSFLEVLHHYVGSTDEYWAKTKALIKSGDAEKKEKGFLNESIAALKNRAQGFNGRFKVFADTVQKDTPLIKGLLAYDELIRELEPKVAKAR